MAKTISDGKYLQDYVGFLNELLNRFVTDSRLSLLAGPNTDLRLVARRQNRRLLPLELQPRGSLLFRQLVRRETRDDGDHVVVEQAVYQYSISLDHDLDWVFRYEYNRSSEPGRPHSHLHVNAVHPTATPPIDFSRLHFPTGRLSIEQLLAYLILEHGVESRSDDPIRELAETHRRFTLRRTDLDNPPFP